MRYARAVLGFALGIVARLWLSTLRLRVELHPSLQASSDDRPWVLAFFHGKQWPLLAWKRRRATAALVSLSSDGEIQTRALGVLGLTVVRGSSSRGGARGLAAVVRLLRHGQHDAAFAVDGPRGPYGVAKPGVVLAARRAGAILVPMGSAVARGKTLTRAWDRFTIAWPWSRVSVVLGPAVELDAPQAGDAGADVDRVAAAIHAANASAEAMLAGKSATVVRFSRAALPSAEANRPAE